MVAENLLPVDPGKPSVQHCRGTVTREPVLGPHLRIERIKIVPPNICQGERPSGDIDTDVSSSSVRVIRSTREEAMSRRNTSPPIRYTPLFPAASNPSAREGREEQILSCRVPGTRQRRGRVECRARASPVAGSRKRNMPVVGSAKRIVDKEPSIGGPVRLRYGGNTVGPAVEHPIDRNRARVLREHGRCNGNDKADGKREEKTEFAGHGDFGSLHGTRISSIICSALPSFCRRRMEFRTTERLLVTIAAAAISGLSRPVTAEHESDRVIDKCPSQDSVSRSSQCAGRSQGLRNEQRSARRSVTPEDSTGDLRPGAQACRHPPAQGRGHRSRHPPS